MDNQPAEDFYGKNDILFAEEDESEESFYGANDEPSRLDTDAGQLEAVSKGAAGGLIESAGMLGGAVIGGKMGVVGGPWGVAGGALIGGGLGLWGGSEVREETTKRGYTYEKVEDLPEELRPYAVAGESLGGAVPFMGAPVALGMAQVRTQGKNIIGRWINNMLSTAAKHPKEFLAVEASMGTSAAIAAGVSEEIFPGNVPIRTGAEMTAGFFNPARIVTLTTRGAINQTRKIVQLMSPAGRQTAAGRILTETITEHGEDPILLARILKERITESEIMGEQLKLTSAQVAGSPALGAMQKTLAAKSAQFGAESSRMAEEGLDGIREMIHLLRRTGDPQALQQAAELRKLQFRTLIEGRVQRADEVAMRAAEKITKDTPAARMGLSKKATGAYTEVFRDVRKAESELWDQVSQDTPAKINGILVTYRKLKADILLEEQAEKLPAVAKNFLKRIADDGGTTTGEVYKFRSAMMNKMREAQAAGTPDQARIYGELGEAALDDMDSAFLVLPGEKEIYENARTFSRELHDSFTRTFAGKATVKGKYGPRVPPELMMQKALATGKEAGALHFQELEDATRFMMTRGLEDDTSFNVMMDAQERIFRLMADEAVDPVTGKVSVSKMTRFIKNQEDLLDRFPEVRDDLTKALASEEHRAKIVSSAKGLTNVVEKQTVFAKLANTDPITVSKKALLSMDQEKDLKELIKIAKRGGSDANDGLKSSIFAAAIDRASTEAGTLQLDRLKNILLKPKLAGGKSPIDILKEGGVLTDDGVLALNKMFKQADNIMRAQKPGTAIDLDRDVADVIFGAFMGLGGSWAAGKFAGASLTSAHGLIVHGTGASLGRKLGQLPQRQLKYVFIEMMNDPEFMLKVLEKPATEAIHIEKMRQVHAYLIQAGIFNTLESMDPDEPLQTEAQ